MERVVTLIERLHEQISEDKSIEVLLDTVQMIQSELLHLQQGSRDNAAGPAVALHIPSVYESILNQPDSKGDDAEKVFLTLEIDEQEIEEELEEIRRNAEEKNLLSSKHRPAFRFDPVEDTPTLSQQVIIEQQIPTPAKTPQPKQELDQPLQATPQADSTIEKKSDTSGTEINEQLKKNAREISDTLSDAPIKDLKKAIGINDRFLYINELFKGDEVMYDRSIKTINSFEAYGEAEFWIKKELKLKLGWNEKDEIVRQFDHLVRRRFSMV